jgi:hypothetical protein
VVLEEQKEMSRIRMDPAWTSHEEPGRLVFRKKKIKKYIYIEEKV